MVYGNIEDFNVADGRIFYVTNPGPGTNLYSLTPGGEPRVVYTDWCANFSIAGDWIFFINHQEEYKVSMIRTNGTHLQFVK